MLSNHELLVMNVNSLDSEIEENVLPSLEALIHAQKLDDRLAFHYLHDVIVMFIASPHFNACTVLTGSFHVIVLLDT